MVFKLIIWLLLLPCFVFGFRVIPDFKNWDVDRTSETNSKLFVVLDDPNSLIPNDLPSGDVLHGSSTLTKQQVLSAVLDDFNNIVGSYIILVDNSDVDFANRGENRTITIKDGSALGLGSGGHAKPKIEDGKMIGCDIVLKSEMFENAKVLTFAITHEMGHCLGLNHPMDTTHAIMSYFYDWEDNPRLQLDDKMGLVYLYPVNPDKAKEQATLGLACSRKE
jgi:hypothetical protein